MATVLFLAGGRAQAGPSFSMDCYTDISSNFTARVTKHPVEGGSDISDHVITENAIFELKGYVSNHPVAKQNTNWPGTIPLEGGDRVSTAYAELKKLYRGRAPFTLVTSYDTFPNCVITMMGIEERSGFSTEDAIEVNLSIEQIRVFASESIVVGVAAVLDIPDQKKSGGGSVVAGISRVERWIGGSGFVSEFVDQRVNPLLRQGFDLIPVSAAASATVTPISIMVALGKSNAAD